MSFNTVQGKTACCNNPGGGIYNDHATLTIRNCAFSGNSAPNNGGAIYNAGATTVNASSVNGNWTYNFSDGGGIYNDHGTLTVTNCSLTGNGTYYYGGGIYDNSGTLSGTSSMQRLRERLFGDSHGDSLPVATSGGKVAPAELGGDTAQVSDLTGAQGCA